MSAPTRHIAHAVALLPALVLLLTAGAVHAQGFGKKGTLEIGGEGSYSSRTLEVGTAPLSQSIDQSETRITVARNSNKSPCYCRFLLHSGLRGEPRVTSSDTHSTGV